MTSIKVLIVLAFCALQNFFHVLSQPYEKNTTNTGKCH